MNYDKILKFAHESVGRADDAGRFAIALVEQQATLERYKAALEFYTGEQHIAGDSQTTPWNHDSNDWGNKAREALAGSK